jgi:hypothetical protein
MPPPKIKYLIENSKVLLELNVSLFRRYVGILIYMFLDVVLHEDAENGIKNWKKLLLGYFYFKK